MQISFWAFLKKNVDDLRESSSLKLINILKSNNFKKIIF